jgi:hypothetical protein
MDTEKKLEPVCGVSTSMPHTHILQCKPVQPTTTTHHISSPLTTTTKMTCQPLYHLPSSNKAKLHLHHLCRLQSNPRESQPQLSQPHEDVQLHHQHAPLSIIDEPMICHLHEISSSLSTVLLDPQKSQPSNEPSRQGTTNPSQVLASRMSPDTALQMQQPQYWVTSHKHQRD